VRLEAAHLFEQGVSPVQVARRTAGEHEVGVSVAATLARLARSRLGVQGHWRDGVPTGRRGAEATACRAGSRPRRLGCGQDQRWTLGRVATPIGWLFPVRYTLRGVSYLLHRMAFPHRCRCIRPLSAMRRRSRLGARRPGRRCEAATGAYVCFEDKAGQKPATAQGEGLGAPQPHRRGEGAWQEHAPGLSRRSDLLRPFNLCSGQLTSEGHAWAGASGT
jgi:hypothetical protein